MGAAGRLESAARPKIEEPAQLPSTFHRTGLNLLSGWRSLRTLVENSHESVQVLDLQGKIRDINPSGTRLLEAQSRRMVLQESASGFVADDHRDSFLRQLDTARSGECSVVELEWISLRGNRRTVESRVIPLWEPHGGISAFLCLTRDITLLKHYEAKLREFPARLIDAQEEERNRIGREIHDDYGQQLAHISIGIECLSKLGNVEPDVLARQLRKLRDQVSQLATEMQALSHTLAPADLANLGLEGAVEKMCRMAFQKHDTVVHFECGDLPWMEEDIELSIYRIIQEALHNIWSHSQATEARIEIRGLPHCISLTVSDNGIGFEYVPDQPGGGMGLTNLRDRALAQGGLCSISTSPGEGTRIRVQLPVAAPGAMEKCARSAARVNGNRSP